jgi:drug/metabolite transporter (DMT)-like permease
MASTTLPVPVSTRKQALADGALLGVTLIWGSTFVLVKDIVAQVSPMLFLSVRFALGAVALAMVVVLARRWSGLTMREVAWGAGIGSALWAGYALQTIGLQWTTASNAGFITGLSVVLVPVLGIFVLRHAPDGWAWTGVALATVGLALLSLRLDQGMALNVGDLLVLGCALAFALQIVLVARVAGWADPLRVTMVQVLVAGLLNAVAALLFERPMPGLSAEIWAGAAFLGVVATALAIAIQMSVQSFTTAVHTALIFTMEPVFAAVFGFWLQGDRLGPGGWVGAVLILGGMLLAELGPQLHTRVSGRAASKQASPAHHDEAQAVPVPPAPPALPPVPTSLDADLDRS